MNLIDDEITDERWAELLEEQKQSSLPILDWCERHRISFKAFSAAKKRLAQRIDRPYIIAKVGNLDVKVFEGVQDSVLNNTFNAIINTKAYL